MFPAAMGSTTFRRLGWGAGEMVVDAFRDLQGRLWRFGDGFPQVPKAQDKPGPRRHERLESRNAARTIAYTERVRSSGGFVGSFV